MFTLIASLWETLRNPFVAGCVALTLISGGFSWHTSNIKSAAYEQGFNDAKKESTLNDFQRASEIRNRAASAGLSFGSPVPRPATRGLRGAPNPQDTRGYRD